MAVLWDMEVTRWTLGLWAIAWPVLLVLACIRGSVGSHAGPMELLLASAVSGQSTIVYIV